MNDVIVGVVSLSALARVEGTPVVLEAPGSVGAVVVATVVDVTRDGDRLDVELGLDAVAVLPDPAFTDARLVGRASVAHSGHVRVHTTGDPLRHPSSLPEDIVEGDIVALPWSGEHPFGSVPVVHEPAVVGAGQPVRA
ncbi:hypothetical protein GCM10027568_32270 [Humibacter soli]